jgi:hypothetical protein
MPFRRPVQPTGAVFTLRWIWSTHFGNSLLGCFGRGALMHESRVACTRRSISPRQANVVPQSPSLSSFVPTGTWVAHSGNALLAHFRADRSRNGCHHFDDAFRPRTPSPADEFESVSVWLQDTRNGSLRASIGYTDTRATTRLDPSMQSPFGELSGFVGNQPISVGRRHRIPSNRALNASARSRRS